MQNISWHFYNKDSCQWMVSIVKGEIKWQVNDEQIGNRQDEKVCFIKFYLHKFPMLYWSNKSYLHGDMIVFFNKKSEVKIGKTLFDIRVHHFFWAFVSLTSKQAHAFSFHFPCGYTKECVKARLKKIAKNHFSIDWWTPYFISFVFRNFILQHTQIGKHKFHF